MLCQKKCYNVLKGGLVFVIKMFLCNTLTTIPDFSVYHSDTTPLWRGRNSSGSSSTGGSRVPNGYDEILKGLNTLDYFYAIFTREATFVTYCLLSFTLCPFEKGVCFKREEFAPK